MKRLPKSLSAEAIRTAWTESRDSTPSKAGAAGVDNMTASAFASHLARHISEMRDDIRAGTYRFSRLRMAPVPKSSGGYRIIAVPTVRDRLIQRALLRHLENAPRFKATSSISFGFTKGKTLPDAQRCALVLRQAHPWVIQADIVKFFDQIPRPDVKALIRKHVSRKAISDLLLAAVDCELDDGQGRGAEIARANGIKKGLGLRQGMPVSPMLSNLLLKKFDDALVQRGVVAIRYADDIAVFGDSRNDCLDALKFIQLCLSRLQLNIPDLAAGGKTILSGPSETVEFLGVEIKRFGEIYKLCPPTKKMEKIEEAMAKMTSLGQCVAQKRNIGHVVRALDSLIIGHHASMMVLDDPGEFLARLLAAKHKHQKELLISLIGKAAVRALDDNRLAILGVQGFEQ